MIFRSLFVLAVIVTPWYAQTQINELLPSGFYPALAIYYMIALGAVVEGWNRGR
jgi:hypothetical protein